MTNIKEVSLSILKKRKTSLENQIKDLENEVKMFGNSSNRLGILNKLKFNLCNLNKDIEKIKYHE